MIIWQSLNPHSITTQGEATTAFFFFAFGQI